MLFGTIMRAVCLVRLLHDQEELALFSCNPEHGLRPLFRCHASNASDALAKRRDDRVQEARLEPCSQTANTTLALLWLTTVQYCAYPSVHKEAASLGVQLVLPT